MRLTKGRRTGGRETDMHLTTANGREETALLIAQFALDAVGFHCRSSPTDSSVRSSGGIIAQSRGRSLVLTGPDADLSGRDASRIREEILTVFGGDCPVVAARYQSLAISGDICCERPTPDVMVLYAGVRNLTLVVDRAAGPIESQE